MKRVLIWEVEYKTLFGGPTFTYKGDKLMSIVPNEGDRIKGDSGQMYIVVQRTFVMSKNFEETEGDYIKLYIKKCNVTK